ncbi:hypothetical protein Golomagni_05344 [Golovinomyces magnicellulatus]|nr:hypothetical protein Golomagni_05344 [Golovinomyces magnicellulatus]
MAVGSVTSRQTMGLVFESSQAYLTAMLGTRDNAAQEREIGLVECDYLISGETGDIMERFLKDKTKVELQASVGFARVFNQTQLTRERHHLTHSSENKYSLGTSSGKAAGGGIATSEMDFHAMFSSGMVVCAQELLKRGNVERVLVCTALYVNKSAKTYEVEHV